MDFTYKEADVPSKFNKVAPSVKFLAEEIGMYAPRAVILNCIEPVCCTMPLIQATMNDTALYNPGKIVGCISQVQVLTLEPFLHHVF